MTAQNPETSSEQVEEPRDDNELRRARRNKYQRIVDMGIEPLMVSSTVLSVTAQRLGRRLCSGCKAKMDPADVPSNEELISYGFHEEELSGIEFYKAVGCSLCNKGYKGRFAMVEALEITKPVKKMILAGASSMDLRKVAIEAGMMTMRRCGLLNATRGITSLAEVLNSTVGDTEEE